MREFRNIKYLPKTQKWQGRVMTDGRTKKYSSHSLAAVKEWVKAQRLKRNESRINTYQKRTDKIGMTHPLGADIVPPSFSAVSAPPPRFERKPKTKMIDHIECMNCGYQGPQTHAVCRACGNPLPVDESFAELVDSWFDSYDDEEETDEEE